jgi:hypothetical protein
MPCYSLIRSAASELCVLFSFPHFFSLVGFFLCGGSGSALNLVGWNRIQVGKNEEMYRYLLF